MGLSSPPILALGVSVRLDLTGRNWDSWKATEWYSLGVSYENTDAFRTAVFSKGYTKPPPNVDGNWTLLISKAIHCLLTIFHRQLWFRKGANGSSWMPKRTTLHGWTSPFTSRSRTIKASRYTISSTKASASCMSCLFKKQLLSTLGLNRLRLKPHFMIPSPGSALRRSL
jgi:hypothetical protein